MIFLAFQVHVVRRRKGADENVKSKKQIYKFLEYHLVQTTGPYSGASSALPAAAERKGKEAERP